MSELSQEQLDILIGLQKIESEAGRIDKIIGAADDKIAALDAKLESFKKGVDEKEAKLNELKDKYKIFENDYREKEARIQKSKDTLKVVKTNKEYQVLLREIDENIKQNSQIEEIMIQELDLIEREDKDLSERKAELVQLESMTKDQKKSIVDEFIEEREELDRISEERKKISVNLQPKLLELFNKTLRVCDGLAVVPIANGICRGCYMNLPPQLFIEIQRGGELHLCQRCQRILYYEASLEEQEG